MGVFFSAWAQKFQGKPLLFTIYRDFINDLTYNKKRYASKNTVPTPEVKRKRVSQMEKKKTEVSTNDK